MVDEVLCCPCDAEVIGKAVPKCADGKVPLSRSIGYIPHHCNKMPNRGNLRDQVFFRLMVSGNMVHCSGEGTVGDYLEWQEPAASTSHILADHEAESKLEVGPGINP